jgi:hypothetical protein
MSGSPGYRYSVERITDGTGPAEVALVRRAEHHGVMGRVRGRSDEEVTVLFRRTFRPMLELDQLERYAAELEAVATHANAGTLGCFVDKRSQRGVVEIRLYERWFDGRELRCEELAHREFDAGDPDALVASSEFLGELEEWAERQNDQRQTSYLEASVEDADRRQRALEQASAGDELARILDSVDRTGR